MAVAKLCSLFLCLATAMHVANCDLGHLPHILFSIRPDTRHLLQTEYRIVCPLNLYPILDFGLSAIGVRVHIDRITIEYTILVNSNVYQSSQSQQKLK